METTTINKKECGCEEEITTKGSYIRIIIKNRLCEKHQKEQEERKNERITNTIKNCDEKLNCDICEEQIGWVHNFDLNGSSFICNDCKNYN